MRSAEHNVSANRSSIDQRALNDQIRCAAADLDRALDAFGARISTALDHLRIAEKTRAKRIKAAQGTLAAAKQLKKLSSVGAMNHVTLYETAISYAGNTYPLSEAVRAEVSQQGMRQVVQGWVFKSNQERRELYLHVVGPGWSFVVPINLQYSAVRPAQLMTFADAINMTAANAARMRHAFMSRVREAEHTLGAAERSDASIEAAAALVTAARDVEDLDSSVTGLKSLLANADRNQRRVRKAVDLLSRYEELVARAQSDSEAEYQRVHPHGKLAESKSRIATISPPPQSRATGNGDRSVDAWLTRVATALESEGFAAERRSSRKRSFGEVVLGDIELRSRHGTLRIELYVDEEAAKRAEQDAKPEIAASAPHGQGLHRAVGRIQILASSRAGIDPERFRFWAQRIAAVDPPTQEEVVSKSDSPPASEATTTSSPPVRDEM